MNSSNKTFLPTKPSSNRNWIIIDCKGQKLGRLASLVTAFLKGKGKPHYFPSIDIGDSVILINAELLLVNEENKHYIVNQPGRPGRSLKVKKISECLPKYTIERAVKGMLSKTETKRLMRRLKIYNGNHHPHDAQNPTKINITDLYSNSQLKLN